ncbi:fam-h protein [Plasmodium relictum]|uniref:Fam-h protein n=1 Tax=Plasmodium relictum TaxID=85471 RepID=A0A1J1GK39_PLARL|nr:fam-h protein [Plasmodium relictum]CRG84687.1 fam-h protein [Plasmodium relictum]
MNRKNKIMLIPSIRMHPMYYYRVSKDLITTDVSTLKLCSKREKKNLLYFLMKSFIFILLIWILKFYNNWDSYKSWNHENGLKNVLDLGYKRSLAESNDAIKQTKKGLNYHDQHDILETYSESRNEKNEIEENIDVEQEGEIETERKNQNVKLIERTLDKCKSNLKLFLLGFSILLSLLSLVLYTFFFLFEIYSIESPSFILFTLCHLIISTLLILERIEIKYVKKFK